MERMTIERIIAIEPRVARVLDEAKRRPYREEDLDGLYSEYKARLSLLVGWSSPHKKLRTCRAYDIMIRALCDALDY